MVNPEIRGILDNIPEIQKDVQPRSTEGLTLDERINEAGTSRMVIILQNLKTIL